MKKLLQVSLCLGLTVLLTGCFESTTLIRVEKDGSGEVLVREFLSNDVLSMMDSMQGLTGEAASGETGLSAVFQGLLDEKVNQLGAGVELVESKSADNAKGWKGYQARFAFADITQVTLDGSAGPDGNSGGPELSYRFDFEPGDVATLRIVPDRVAGEYDDSADEPGEDETVDDAMAAMMGPMLEGMKVSLFIQVAGRIVETDASYPVEGRDNIVALMEVDFGQIGSHPGAMKLITSKDPNMLTKMRKLDIPGLRVEDDTRTITIRYR